MCEQAGLSSHPHINVTRRHCRSVPSIMRSTCSHLKKMCTGDGIEPLHITICHAAFTIHHGSTCPHRLSKCPGLKARLLVRPGRLPQSGPEAFAKPVNKRCYSSPVILKVCRMTGIRTRNIAVQSTLLAPMRPSSCTRKLVLRCKVKARLSQIMGQPRKIFEKVL